MPHVLKKPLARTGNLVQTKKLGLEWTMDWENHLEKNPIQKIEKTVNIKVKLPHLNKKPLARKRTFVQTSFSHSTLKLERKKLTPPHLLLHFLF